MSKKLLFKGGHATGMARYEIEDFSTLYMRDARVDEKTKAYIDSVIGNSVLNLCPYRNVLVTHKYDTVEGNVITLDDCQDDEVIQLSEIQGNTMVNCCKDGSKELTLNGDIDTSGYNNVTLTEGVDDGKVDVALEGNTMVNVCDQEDPIAITKNYEVTTGNHVALQGEYDGKCRPNVYGNTLVNLIGLKTPSLERPVESTNIYNITTRNGYIKVTTDSVVKESWLYVRFPGLKASMFKPSTTYTICFSKLKGVIFLNLVNGNGTNNFITDNIITIDNKLMYTFTTRATLTVSSQILYFGVSQSNPLDIEIENPIILEGDYTNKPIPEYFTGMQSSFEDKLVPENLAKFKQFGGCFKDCISIENDIITITNPATDGAVCYNIKGVKPNTTYTFYFNVLEHTEGVYFNFDLYPDSYKELGSFANVGENRIVYTMPNDVSTLESFRIYIPSGNTTTTKITKPIIVEGDYTNYDFTDYDSTKGGKYKVDYKVTGKNKCPRCTTTSTSGNGITFMYDATTQTFSYSGTATNTSTFLSIPCPNLKLLKDKSYIFNVDNPLTNFSLQATELGVGYNCNLPPGQSATPIVNLDKFTSNSIMLYSQNLTIGQSYSGTFKVQIEEGTTATTYEPYKESIKTLYLNTPLLEGDTIEQSGNDIVHMHRYNKVVLDGSDDELWYLHNNTNTNCNEFRCTRVNNKDLPLMASSSANSLCDKYITQSSGDIERFAWGRGAIYLCILKTKLDYDLNKLREYLNSNPIICIGELATPTREVISTNDNLLLDSYKNGHLDMDSVVPIDKVVFQSNFNKSLRYLYPNTEYTIQFESDNIGKIDKIHLGGINSSTVNAVKGINRYTLTTGELSSKSIIISGIGFNMSKIVITPKVDEDFGYFKGMKSVGECENNKIEILSSNGNLCERLEDSHYKVYGGTVSIIEESKNSVIYTTSDWDSGFSYLIGTNGLFKNKRYCISWEKPTNSEGIGVLHAEGLKLLDSDKKQKVIIPFVKTTLSAYEFELPNAFEHGDIIELRFKNGVIDNTNGVCNIRINEGNTIESYVEGKLNKKEILLNEPLRGLPNGVRDKYVMIDGKWFIERNTVEIDLSTIPLKEWRTWTDLNTEYWSFYAYHKLLKRQVNEQEIANTCCNTRPDITNMNTIRSQNGIGVHTGNGNSDSGGYIAIGFKRTELSPMDNTGLKQWLTNNPTKVIAEAQTPTYEPIEYNSFEVYTDITYISNNSIIPCNMVIKNSGYNCILKPSTLYTIALDTNKSGTIGMNLGGAKVTTTNNVTTITTPATLTDNTLRLYGKGIKGSKVRLLEGDKTNWIPSHFEGMKSSFEDKVQEDGSYKMEISSNNKNLINIKDYNKNNWGINISYSQGQIVLNGTLTGKDDGLSDYYLVGGWDMAGDNLNLKPNTRYTFSGNIPNGVEVYIIHKAKVLCGINSGNKIVTWTNGSIRDVNALMVRVREGHTFSNTKINIQIEEGSTSTAFVNNIYNKIQFLMNEPLRGLPNGIKDKYVIKDNKLMIQRNCGHKVLDGTENSWQAPSNNNYKYGVFTLHLPLNHKDVQMNDKNEQGALCNTLRPYWWWTTNNDSFETVPDNSIHYLTWHNVNSFYIIKKNLKTVDELKQWLKSNKTEYIYPLATPIYEEVELDKLVLEGYENGTLFYDTNIPVTTQFYDFDVNIKDMLILNETYYVTFIADRVKDITINLSGVQVKYKTSMGYNKVPIQLGDVVNTNFSMDSRGVELSDLMISTSTSLIYVKDMNDVCVYDEASNKYSITITSTNGKESDKRVILLDYPLLKLNKDVYDRLYYSNKDSRYRIDKKVFKHKFTNDQEYNKYAAETNDTYYSSFISLNEAIKDYVIITNEKVKTVKVEDDKYYFKIKWSDLGVSDKMEANGNQGVKDFFNNNEVYLYYSTDGFVEIVDGLTRQTLKVYQPETTMKFLGNTTTTVTILIPMKNV